MVKKIVENWKVDDSKPVIVEKYDKVSCAQLYPDLLYILGHKDIT